MHGHAAPWLPLEIEAALKLRLLATDLVASRDEELAALNADLARSREDLDGVAYVAGHDLKEPLRGIHTHARYLLEEAKAGRALDAQAIERIELLLRLTSRMDTLLDSLLHFSRTGRLKPAFTSASLESIVQEAVEMLGARVLESGIEIHIARPLPEIWCDPARIREVFTNLIANGIKYNDKPHKWVEIGFVAREEPAPEILDRSTVPQAALAETVFYVRDNGIGISPHHYDQVFRMFRRLHTPDAFGGGSGAGLTIVRKLIEQHGGRIWLASTPRVGTTFFFTLPGSQPA